MKVAEVLNSREIAVSGGKSTGVAVGDLLIVRAKPREIRDPDTNETIGEVSEAKAVVRVYDVQDRFALARTFRKRKINVGGSGIGQSPFARLMEPPKYEVQTETLRRDPKKVDDLDEDESVVKVGDLVEPFEGDPDDVPKTSAWS